MQSAAIAHSTLEGKKTLLKREREGLESKLENMQLEQEGLQKRQTSSENRLIELRNSEEHLNKSIEEKKLSISKINSSLFEAKRQENDSVELLLEFKTALAVEEKAFQALEEQKAPITERMAELESAINRRESEVSSYSERIEIAKTENQNLIVEIEQLNNLCESLKSDLEQIINQRQERIKSVENAEGALSETRGKIAKLNEQKGQEEVKMTQIDLRVESLCSTINKGTMLILNTSVQTVISFYVLSKTKRKPNRQEKKEKHQEKIGFGIKILMMNQANRRRIILSKK